MTDLTLESGSLADSFSYNGYLKIDDFISSEITALSYAYTQMQIRIGSYEERFEPMSRKYGFRGKVVGCYGDTFMECLLAQSTPLIESVTGHQLWPCYSYVRQYYQGADLAWHTDRPSSEYIASITLGYDYDNLGDDDYQWPIYLREKAFDVPVGSAIIFRGMDIPHWRNKLLGNSHCQLFLSWVDKKGEWAKYCKYDGRPWLGAPAEARFPHLFEAYLKKVEQHEVTRG